MPYRWTDTDETHKSLELWPHRSLTSRGFVAFFTITALFFLFPLSAVFGTVTLWFILGPIILTVALTWAMIQRSYRDGELLEVLTIAHDRMELIRSNPRGPDQTWQANPYWVEVEMHEKGGPVANYVTLRGSDRTVEIGAFLSPEERVLLYRDLQDRLRGLDINAH